MHTCKRNAEVSGAFTLVSVSNERVQGCRNTWYDDRYRDIYALFKTMTSEIKMKDKYVDFYFFMF